MERDDVLNQNQDQLNPVVEDTTTEVIPPIVLGEGPAGEALLSRLLSDVEDLERISMDIKLRIDDDDVDGGSFREAFAQREVSHKISEENSPVVKELPEIVKKLIDEKGLTGYLEMFQSGQRNKSVSEVFNDFLKQSEDKLKDKPFGEIGEYTINQAVSEGLRFIKPLKDQIKSGLDGVGLDYSDLGHLVSFMFLFNNICKGHGYIIKKYSPSREQYEKLSPADKLRLEQVWVKSHKQFKLIAAPILVLVLYSIKNIVVSPQVKVSLDVNVGDESINNPNPNPNPIPKINKSFSFFSGMVAFSKKLPNYTGNLVLSILGLGLLKYILKIYSINLMDPFYMSKFYLFGMLITSILTLDSLLEFILYYYYKKNKDIVISNKLPKIIYDYFYKFKIICEIDGFNPRYFLVNSLMYFMLLLLLIIIYVIV